MAHNVYRALVVGGTGFIGSHVVESLLADGVETHVVLKDETSREKLTSSAAISHIVDIRDAEAVKSLYAEVVPEEVFHLAMSPMQMGHIAPAREVIETNVLGTANLMDALSAVPEARFVYTGSFTEVGGGAGPEREDRFPQPPELYNVTKLAGTLYGQALAQNKGFNIVTGRVFTPYGPRIQRGRLADAVIRCAVAGEPIILTSPSVSRDFIYAPDIAKMFRELAKRAVELRGEVFNVGTGRRTTLKEFVEIVKGVTASSSDVLWNPEKQVSYDLFPWQADMAKTFSHLSWRPEHTLEQGLEKTIAWIRDNP